MNIEIANKLLQLRKQYNLSQEELAEKIGVTRQAVSKWERAEASPDIDNLIKLAQIYNVSLDNMLLSNNNGNNHIEYDSQLKKKESVVSIIKKDTRESKKILLVFPYPVLTVIIFLIIGFSFDKWHPGWMVFLTIPFYYWLVDSYYKSN